MRLIHTPTGVTLELRGSELYPIGETPAESVSELCADWSRVLAYEGLTGARALAYLREHEAIVPVSRLDDGRR